MDPGRHWNSARQDDTNEGFLLKCWAGSSPQVPIQETSLRCTCSTTRCLCHRWSRKPAIALFEWWQVCYVCTCCRKRATRCRSRICCIEFLHQPVVLLFLVDLCTQAVLHRCHEGSSSHDPQRAQGMSKWWDVLKLYAINIAFLS